MHSVLFMLLTLTLQVTLPERCSMQITEIQKCIAGFFNAKPNLWDCFFDDSGWQLVYFSNFCNVPVSKCLVVAFYEEH